MKKRNEIIKIFGICMIPTLVLAGAIGPSLATDISRETKQDSPRGYQNPQEWVGEEHNKGVEFILSNIKEIPKADKVVSVVTELVQKYFNDPSIKLKCVFDNPYDYIKMADISPELAGYIIETLELLKVPGSLETKMNLLLKHEIKIANSNDLSPEELVLFYQTAAVARHSLKFWTPKSEGGMSGLEFLQIPGYNNLYNLRQINWWKVFACDCVGGIIAGAPGYAGASICSAINQID